MRKAGLLAFVLSSWGMIALAQANEILHRGNNGDPASLDPARSETNIEYHILTDLFLGLFQPGPDGRWRPGAASSWSISHDGRVVTYRLRPGLVWSDGHKLSAEDFVYSFQRVLDPATHSAMGQIAFKVKNALAVSQGRLPPAELGVRAPDERTFVVELEEPTPTFPLLVTQQTFLPVPKHVVEKYGDDWTKPGVMVSNGPYKLASWRLGEQIRLVKNPLFYEATSVRIDEVRFYPTDDAAAAVLKFRAGDLDLNMNFPANDVARLRRILPKGSVHTFPTYSVIYLVPNHTKPPFNDPRVRRAVSLAIDREFIAERILGLGEEPKYGFLPIEIPGYSPVALDFEQWPRAERKEQAIKLLSKAGYGQSNPLRIQFDYIANQTLKQVAIAQADMLRQVGITVELLQHDQSVHFARIATKDFVLSSAGWSGPLDPEFYMYAFLSTSTSTNAGYANAAFDSLCNQAARTTKIAERMRLYQRAEKVLLSDSALIPLYTQMSRTLVAPYVKGYVDNALSLHPTRWMRIEGRKQQ